MMDNFHGLESGKGGGGVMLDRFCRQTVVQFHNRQYNIWFGNSLELQCKSLSTFICSGLRTNKVLHRHVLIAFFPSKQIATF